MSVAVVGAGGFIGKHLCAGLMAQGVDVLRLSAGQANGISLETGLLPVGFTFPHGVEAVYFLAQSPRYRELPEQRTHLLTVNCLAAAQAAHAAQKAGVARFIYASTGNVYVPSFSRHTETSAIRRDDWYALSKVMAEDLLTLYRPYFDVTIARIFGVYGPGQVGKLVPIIADAVRSGREVSVDRNPSSRDDLDGLRVSLIYIDDLTSSLVRLLSGKSCEVLNVAGSEAVSIRRLADALGTLFGVEPRIVVSNKYRQADLIADVTLYETLFGRAKVMLEEGLARCFGGTECEARK